MTDYILELKERNYDKRLTILCLSKYLGKIDIKKGIFSKMYI